MYCVLGHDGTHEKCPSQVLTWLKFCDKSHGRPDKFPLHYDIQEVWGLPPPG
jgi:hypothetical protein